MKLFFMGTFLKSLKYLGGLKIQAYKAAVKLWQDIDMINLKNNINSGYY